MRASFVRIAGVNCYSSDTKTRFMVRYADAQPFVDGWTLGQWRQEAEVTAQGVIPAREWQGFWQHAIQQGDALFAQAVHSFEQYCKHPQQNIERLAAARDAMVHSLTQHNELWRALGMHGAHVPAPIDVIAATDAVFMRMAEGMRAYEWHYQNPSHAGHALSR